MRILVTNKKSEQVSSCFQREFVSAPYLQSRLSVDLSKTKSLYSQFHHLLFHRHRTHLVSYSKKIKYIRKLVKELQLVGFEVRFCECGYYFKIPLID